MFILKIFKILIIILLPLFFIIECIAYFLEFLGEFILTIIAELDVL